MLLQTAFKLSEPFTLLSDGILGFQSLLFGLLIAKSSTNIPKKDFFTKIMLGFLSLSIFAFSGAISHFTTENTVYQFTWPMTVIFGGIALFWFDLALIDEYFQLNMKWDPKFTGSVVALLGYLIILIFSDWNFGIFGVLLLVFTLHFMLLSHQMKKNDLNSQFYYAIRRFLYVIVILGIIQVFGKIFAWNFYYGPSSEYLFQIGNEIFHIGFLLPNYLLFHEIKKMIGNYP